MNANPDPLLESLAAMSPEFDEFNSAGEGLRAITAELFPLLARHQKAADQITARVSRGKDIDAQVAEIRGCVSAYPSKLRTLAYNCLRMADIAETIHGKFNDLGKP